MSFEIQTTSSFDAEAKRLAKRHRSFIDNLQDFTFTYLVDEKDGVVILLLLYDKADASSIKMNVVRKIIKDLGLNFEKLQSEGKLKSPK